LECLMLAREFSSTKKAEIVKYLDDLVKGYSEQLTVELNDAGVPCNDRMIRWFNDEIVNAWK
jgi:hypothetical protein